ncbi:aldo/keto reductase, partial [Pseudomonas aeruginosa]
PCGVCASALSSRLLSNSLSSVGSPWIHTGPGGGAAPAAPHDASSAQVALAWLLEQGVIAIPKAVTSAHIRLNAAAADLELSADDLRALDQAFPPPTRKRNLAIV